MKMLRKIIRFSLKSLGVLAIILLVLGTVFIYSITLSTPDVDQSIVPENFERKTIGEDHFTVGNNWLRKNRLGIWEVYIEGDDYERGVIYGVLTKELMEIQEQHFVSQLNEIVPNSFYRNILKYIVAWFNRDLDNHIPDEFKNEIYGASKSFADTYDYIGPKYYRILNYHAAHDIGHALNDFNLVGCSSFAIDNTATKDSSMLIARNFDFYMGDNFAKEKLMSFVNPREGYKYASYSWAGFLGVVSGMNEKGLCVTINASKSDIPSGAKVPISLLVREILQYAKNIEEAVAIAHKRETFVSESILIGSAEDGRTAIIEKSPSQMDVFDPEIAITYCTNHYQSDLFKNDTVNLSNIENSDSKYRFDRLQQLLSLNDTITVKSAVAILRDRAGMNNKTLGYGNPKAINQLIAHHGVVFKPQQKLMWVSSNPYQLGEFQYYDLNKVFDGLSLSDDSLNIPADSFLLSKDFKKYEYFKKIKNSISKYVLLGIPFSLKKGEENQFIESNPESYVSYMALGDYYYENEAMAKAAQYYKQALEKEVASKQEREKISAQLKNCKK